jgi:hypothetical protein
VAQRGASRRASNQRAIDILSHWGGSTPPRVVPGNPAALFPHAHFTPSPAYAAHALAACTALAPPAIAGVPINPHGNAARALLWLPPAAIPGGEAMLNHLLSYAYMHGRFDGIVRDLNLPSPY